MIDGRKIPVKQSEAAFRRIVVMRSQSANKSLINRRDSPVLRLRTENRTPRSVKVPVRPDR